MKYIAKPIVEGRANPNVGSSTLLNEVAWLGLASVSFLFGIYLIMAAAVSLTLAFMPPSIEQALGSAFLKLVATNDGHYSVHSERSAAIQTLFDKVVAQAAELPYSTPRIHIASNNEANAVTLPNCNIVIFSGLIDAVKSENELAMIIAHELGHCKNRDNLQALGRTLVFGVLAIAVLGENSEATTLIFDSLAFTNLAYSREQEELADLFALNTLYRLYNHIGGSLDFFKRTADPTGLAKYTYFNSSHPTNDSRIATLEAEIAKRSLPTHETIPWQK